MPLKGISLSVVLILLISSISSGQTDTTAEDASQTYIPLVVLSASDLENDVESQNISGLLQSSRDIFVSTAGYTLGGARFRIRGYDSENTSVMINGIPLNNMETGRVYWSTWGGLNDVLRNIEIHNGISASQHLFAGIGGSTNITTRASSYRKGLKFVYSMANRSYNNRVMLTYATGMMDNGWAFVASGSHRWAMEGYQNGSFYDAWSYFLSAEKRFNKNHSIGLVAFAAPTERGRAGVSIQEVYDLTGTNFYNPYWGYQEGKKRNSRVSKYHQPLMVATHYWKINEQSKLTTSLSYFFGRGGSTALEWYDTYDPRPDYYRNLPSFYKDDPGQFEYYTNLWENDPSVQQIDWEHFYFANGKNLYTVQYIDGVEGNNLTGNRSKYVVEDRRNDVSRIILNSNYNTRLSNNITFSSGINLTFYQGHKFKKMVDLLGGDYWVDVDKFAERDFVDIFAAQNDLQNINNIIEVGDVFGYDYVANINSHSVFAQGEFTYSKVDFFLSGTLSFTEFWRKGNMQNGRFPDASLGDSDKNSFFNYGLKGGVTYKITGRHFLVFNGAYLTRAPYFRNSFISPRTRNQIVNGLTSEKIMSGDANYIYRSPFIKARLTAYYTSFKDQAWSRSFYHEDLNTFVNYNMIGVDKLDMGFELGVEVKLTPTLSVSLVGATGKYIYNSRPVATVSRDNDSEVLDDRVVYLKDYRLGGTPQTAGSVGLRYSSPKYWFAGLNANYFAEAYIEANPDRRTEEALEGLITDDPQWEAVLDQEKMPSGYTVDFFGGKSWRIDKYYVSITLNLNNVLNTTDYRTGGFEQFRYEPKDLDKFPPKYFYMYGRTFFLNFSFRF